MAPLRFSSSRMAIESAKPSPGSVPAASSSINSSTPLPASRSIPSILFIWAEKVLSDCVRLCPSPMTLIKSENTAKSLPSSTGTSSPDCTIAARSPSVFRTTVFPPVLGPVTMSDLYPWPNSRLTGTMFFSSGCLPPFIRRYPRSFRATVLAPRIRAYFALAKMKS
ncbi:hypothetical protein D3C73_1009940 [compost metagenome]